MIFIILFSGGIFLTSSELIRAQETIDSGKRFRARELGIIIGNYPTGKYNAITDVAGVKVGHVTLISGSGKLVPGKGPVRTGVTAILPHGGNIWQEKVPAGGYILNGCGEMTGFIWMEESGYIETPILLTNTLNVGTVMDGVIDYMIKTVPEVGISDDTVNPIVAECDDSTLNDIQGRHVTQEMVLKAIESASDGPVEEGCVGGGTGMICYEFKGGIGTSSRVLPEKEGSYTAGVLVMANQGRRRDLIIKGLPVGKEITDLLSASRKGYGSIIIVVATDAPLTSRQLNRISKRASLGLARTGTTANNGSGEIILSFSTAYKIPHYPEEFTCDVKILSDTHINPLFEAVEEATEEAVINALCAATTMKGRDDNIVYTLPLDRVKMIMKKYGLQ